MNATGETHEAQLLIEAAASRMISPPNVVPTEHQIELSKAISLKRLADAVERIAGCEMHGVFDVRRYES